MLSTQQSSLAQRPAGLFEQVAPAAAKDKDVPVSRDDAAMDGQKALQIDTAEASGMAGLDRHAGHGRRRLKAAQAVCALRRGRRRAQTRALDNRGSEEGRRGQDGQAVAQQP